MTLKELSQYYYLDREIKLCNDKIIETEGLKKQLQEEKKKIEDYISKIDESLTRQIFYRRFVLLQSWTKIAMEIGGYNTEDSVKKICYRYINKSSKVVPNVPN